MNAPNASKAFRPVARTARIAILSRSILADLAHKLIIKRRRHRDQVERDYDQGEWSAQLKQEHWLSAPTLEEYLIPPGDREMVVIKDGRLTRVRQSAYYRFRAKKLIEIVSANDGGADVLVELGSGTGRNIFTLATAGRWRKLYGFDISLTGVRVSNEVKERYAVDSAQFGTVDLLAPDYGDLEVLSGATILTYLCLEQLPSKAEEILRKLVAAGVRRGIHVEPSLELFKRWRLQDLASISYIWRQDYQRGVISAVRKLEAEGLLKVVRIQRMGYAPSPRNEPTLVVWERTSS